MEGLELYEKVRAVPSEALKEIKGGRLKGFTDINPMWRIKCMTQVFGPCGIGWKYEIVRLWTEPGNNGETAAFAQINLYYATEKEAGWSDAIPGIGGSVLVVKESAGLRTNDECYKMALTDAISVACKSLGVGADIYWDKDSTKYDTSAPIPPPRCVVCGAEIKGVKTKDEILTAHQVADKIKQKLGKVICKQCQDAGLE